MKLQIMSDLHLEMHSDRGAEFIRTLDPVEVAVLQSIRHEVHAPAFIGSSRWRRHHPQVAETAEELAEELRAEITEELRAAA